MPDCLELPRPVPLLRTAGWNLAESFGLPTGAYVLAVSVLWLRSIMHQLGIGFGFAPVTAG